MDAEFAGEAAEVNLTQAQAELGERGFSYLSAGRQLIMLNRALNDFEDFYPWPWLYKTATGAAPLTVTDLKYVLSVIDSTGNEITGTDLNEINDTGGVAVTGTPSSWYIDDTSGSPVLRGWPTGSATLTVQYVAEITELANGGDIPNIPVRYHPLWIDLAVIRAYQDSDNFAAANALRQDTEQALLRLVERYETRNRQTSPTIAIRMGSMDD